MNRELQGLLTHLKRRRGARPGARFAVVRLAVKVECYDRRAQAVEALKRVPPSRQLGLIDRKSGETWARGTESFRVIKETLGYLVLKPLRHMGVI